MSWPSLFNQVGLNSLYVNKGISSHKICFGTLNLYKQALIIIHRLNQDTSEDKTGLLVAAGLNLGMFQTTDTHVCVYIYMYVRIRYRVLPLTQKWCSSLALEFCPIDTVTITVQ